MVVVKNLIIYSNWIMGLFLCSEVKRSQSIIDLEHLISIFTAEFKCLFKCLIPPLKISLQCMTTTIHNNTDFLMFKSYTVLLKKSIGKKERKGISLF